MKEKLIAEIEQGMLAVLDNAQLKRLHEVLQHALWSKNVCDAENTVAAETSTSNNDLLKSFLSAKRVEGCSEKTLKYYSCTVQRMLEQIDLQATHITTDHLRQYLSEYQQKQGCSQANIDNIRRILSSFFAWLEDENYIMKSPVRRIHKIRTIQTVKETYSDEALEQMRDNCQHLRDLAMVDLLASTGMRVGELVRLNIADVNFETRECIVFGKGSKERPVYFDARTKIHLQNYIQSRTDTNPALFVSLLKPHARLAISGVEIRVKKIGHAVGLDKVHPHKFRRTLATKAIDKGMPIEQVQHLLGHAQIDTTMHYAMVSQTNVKLSHRKYLG